MSKRQQNLRRQLREALPVSAYRVLIEFEAECEAAGLRRAAKECEDGAAGPGVLFEMDNTLHALGESGVAALRYMAAQFRQGATVAGVPGE